MSYEFYKIVHYISLFIFISGLSISFLSANPPKLAKILTGISSVLILVAGMGLIAKGLSLGHGESWPGWLHAKITIWALVAIGGPIASKRMTSNRGLVLSILMVLMFVAVGLAVTKPF